MKRQRSIYARVVKLALNLDVELLLSAVPLGDQDPGASGNELKGPNRPHICVLSLEQEPSPVSALRLV